MKKPFCLWGKPFLPAHFSIAFLFLCLLFAGCKKPDDHQTFLQPFHVTLTTPQSQQADSPFEEDVRAQLDNAIDTSVFTASILLHQSENLVPGNTVTEDSAVAFVADAALLPSTSYTAVLYISLKNGVNVYHYQWSFTTKSREEYLMTQRSTEVTDGNRDGTKCMQIGQYLYSFGGWKDPPVASYSDVYRSKGDLSVWERRPDAPWHGRHTFGIGVLNGQTYIIGGDYLQNNFDVWRTKNGEDWLKVSENILGNRILYGCTIHNGYIYVVGGGGYNDVQRSRDGVIWETVATDADFLGGECFAGSLASFNGRLWMVCGGTNGYGQGYIRKEVWSSTDGKKWRREKDFGGSERYFTDVIVWDNKLWVVGGFNFTEGNTKTIWYMKRDGTWVEYPTPADYIGRHATGLGIYNNSLTITCGNYNNDCWVIEKVK